MTLFIAARGFKVTSWWRVNQNTFLIYRSTVALGIRKIQFAPNKQGNQPCTVVRKDFLLSPGELELEMTLDKQVSTLAQCKHQGFRITETYLICKYSLL